MEGRNENGQFANGNNKGNRFDSTNQPRNNGRKKNIYSIMKESGYSSADVRTAFGELAWYTESEIKEVNEKPDSPIIVKVVANAYLKAAKEGNYSFIKEIMEQFIGKAMQKAEIKTEVQTVTVDWTS